MRRRVTALVFTGTVVACCGQGTAGAGTPPTQPALVESFPGPLPASFSGDLPCADCPGVRHTVELHPDNVFVYRMTHFGRGEGAKGADSDDLGRWTISPDGRTLTLRGGREAPVMFAVKDERTLRKLDLEGNPIESSLTYDLARAASFEPLEPQLFLRGMYSYMADAGLFAECSTGWRLPVAMEADNVALERGYLAVRKGPGEPVLVSLEGRIAMRPRMEGAGLQRSLVPVRFNKAWPGETCGAAGGGTAVTSLAGTGWRLADARLGVPTPEGVSRITLRFTDAHLSAASGCSTGAAPYALEAGALVAERFAATQKACIGVLQQWEAAVFRFLASKPRIGRESGDLVLTSADGEMRFRSMPMPSAAAVRKFIFVASERKPCAGVGPMSCLQVREKETDPWRLYHGEIIGFTHEPDIEYRLRILEDEMPNPPAGASSKRWYLDLVVERRVVKPSG